MNYDLKHSNNISLKQIKSFWKYIIMILNMQLMTIWNAWIMILNIQ